jgi:hypothetical protein
LLLYKEIIKISFSGSARSPKEKKKRKRKVIAIESDVDDFWCKISHEADIPSLNNYCIHDLLFN